MTSWKDLILVLVILMANTCGAEKGYDGYELIAVTPRSLGHLEFLGQLGSDYGQLDFWSHPMLNESSLVMVPSDLLVIFKELLDGQNIEWTVESTDIMSMIHESQASNLLTVLGQSSGDNFHKKYHDFDELTAYLWELKEAYPDNMEFYHLGLLTHENRGVNVVKLKGNGGSNKKSIIIEAGIHAREWIAPAVNIYAIEKMLEGYRAGSPDESYMLDRYDWYIVPVSNPDGYAYTHLSDGTRLWRKNMRRISRRCMGVDLNRNFDVEFRETGSSYDCASITYHGPRAFSEPETANLRNLFFSLEDSLIAYVSVHSYSQVILLPWMYSQTREVPDNYGEIQRVADSMARAMHSTTGRWYPYGSARDLIGYAAAGTSTDWALVAKKNIYTMCLELRPDRSSRHGFLLPPKQIIPTAREYFAGLKALARDMTS